MTNVRNLIADTIDPIAKKIMKTSGEKVVKTMPKEMIQWFRSTSLFY
jgi:hypothetical protein